MGRAFRQFHRKIEGKTIENYDLPKNTFEDWEDFLVLSRTFEVGDYCRGLLTAFEWSSCSLYREGLVPYSWSQLNDHLAVLSQKHLDVLASWREQEGIT